MKKGDLKNYFIASITQGKKLKTYNVIWSERMSVNIKARSEAEAREKVLNCEHNEAEVSSELDSQPEAYLMK